MRLEYKWQAAIVVAVGLFMGVLDVTIVSVALPQMQAYFHTDRDTITWVATAYLLAQAAVIPVTGVVSDRFGTKNVYLAALAIFTIGSALCAISPTEQWLIAFRVLQGIGGGALFPVAFAIIFRVFPPTERGGASALIGVPVLLAPAFGPTIGGFVTQTWDWRAIFLINLPVGVAAFIGCLVVLHSGARERAESGLDGPNGQQIARQRFDAVGLVLSMVGFTALLYGISEAAVTSWTDRNVVISLVVGGVLLVAFVFNELRVSDPVMDVRLFRIYSFTVANVLTWVVSGFLFASIYLLPIFFQNVQNYSPLQSGEFVIVQGLGAAVATLIAGRLYNRVGPRILVAIGFSLVTIGTYPFTQLDVNTSWQSLQIWLLIRGLGLGLTNIPLQTLAVSAISNRAMARASSLINVTRQVFGAVGITVLTTIFVQQTQNRAIALTKQVASGSPLDPTTPLGEIFAACAKPFGATAPQHATEIQACVAQTVGHVVVPQAQTYGITVAFAVSTIGCAMAIVLALFIGKDPAVEAARQAAARGEAAPETRAMPMGE
jgi:EmrB/QacA subfamily drug resistance transporter